MGITAKETGGNLEHYLLPEGVHIGTCYMMVDIGTQVYEFAGEKKEARKVVIGWEIPEERGDFTLDGKKQNLPLVISKTFTISLHSKAALRHLLENWRGKAFTKAELDGFDIKNVLGAPAQIQVIHESKGDKTYANLAGVMPLPKGMKKPKPETEPQYFSFEDEGVTELPGNLPKWIVERIKASREWANLVKSGVFEDTVEEPPVEPEEVVDDSDDDELPF